MSSRYPEVMPVSGMKGVLEAGADTNGRYVFYLFIKTQYKAAAFVAKTVSGYGNVRWAAELLHPDMTVIAAVVLTGDTPLDDLESLLKDIRAIEGVINPTAAQVPGAVHFKNDDPEPRPVNGWP